MQKDHIDDLLMQYGQEHLVRFWDVLSEEERSILSAQIEAVNWGFLDSFDQLKSEVFQN